MSHISVRGEQSTADEVTALAALTALAASGAGQFIRKTGLLTFENATPSGSGGDVTGPASSTDNALAVWDGAGGDTLKDSTVIVSATVLSPASSDGVALGSATLMWADLFLASGGVINFNNGNVTLTHSAGVLTLGGTATLALGTNSITMTGSIGATGARVTKGWFTDLEITNMPTVGGTSLSSTFQTLDADLTSWAGVTRAAGFDTFVATPSSANLLALVTDETGSGALVFGTSPTFTTSIIAPLIYGGASANGDITIEGTSDATKTTSYIILQPTGGNVGIGVSTPAALLTVGGAQAGNAGLEVVPGSGVVIQGYNRTGGAYASLQFDGSTTGFRTSSTSGTLHTFRQLTTTLAGAVVGAAFDYSTSVTNVAQNVTGIALTTAAVTGAATNTLRGLTITPGAITNVSGTSTYIGALITMPAITQSAGTLTSTGLSIVGGTVTSGTAYALITDATAGNIGFGVAAPASRLHVVSTTEQLRLGYDTSNYLSVTVDSTGNPTFNATGTTPVIKFTDTITPAASDGAALGTTALMWADLFLASGGVINFGNGEMTITAAANSLTLAGGEFAFGANTAYFTETDNGNSSTADTIDWKLGNKQKSTLTGNCTFTFTAPSGPCNLLLRLAQDATGSRTVTWPAAVKWPAGVAPTLTTTASRVDIITFYYDGTTYFGNSSLNFTP